jgi:hypothetical protein
VVVAGEETNKSLSTWLRAAAEAAALQPSESERGERDRENPNDPDGREYFLSIIYS